MGETQSLTLFFHSVAPPPATRRGLIKKKYDLSDYRCSSSSSQLSTTVVRRIRLVRVCVCVQLTYVDPAAVALHQQQHKHVKRDEVDDEDVSAPGRHLWSKTKITVCETGNQHVAPQIQKFMLARGQRMSANLQPTEPKIEPQQISGNTLLVSLFISDGSSDPASASQMFSRLLDLTFLREITLKK